MNYMKEPFRILFVDDDPAILKLFGAKLGEVGFSLVYAKNGNEARDMAKRTKPDLIISDVVMPEMNGIELFQALRADPDTKDIPVIFLTSLEDRAESLQAARELGALDFISKTIDLAEFAHRIQDIAASLENKNK